MSELAFNMNGDPFEVPANATGWRVRRMKPKGAPEVVYGRNGLPLVLPIDAEVDDLRAETTAAGRYRLDPVGDNNKPIEEAPAGYVFVHDQAPAVVTERSALPPASDNIVIEAMRMNSELARSIVDRFPQMMESAALLIRAADGAGIPARAPRLVEDEEESEEDAPASSGFDLNAIVAQAMPLIIAGLSGAKLPSLASLLDWRKAAPRASSPAPAAPKVKTEPKPAEPEAPAATEDTTETLPPLDPSTLAHFVAIQQVLQPDEAALAREVASELQPTELRAWFDELSKLSVPDAVTKIRALIGKDGAS